MRHAHTCRFIPTPKGETRDLGEIRCVAERDACTVQLPAANQAGFWKLSCSHCPAWALVSTERTTRAAQDFTMPCGRLQMHGGEL